MNDNSTNITSNHQLQRQGIGERTDGDFLFLTIPQPMNDTPSIVIYYFVIPLIIAYTCLVVAMLSTSIVAYTTLYFFYLNKNTF